MASCSSIAIEFVCWDFRDASLQYDAGVLPPTAIETQIARKAAGPGQPTTASQRSDFDELHTVGCHVAAGVIGALAKKDNAICPSHNFVGWTKK
jgi:hypothetical protein